MHNLTNSSILGSTLSRGGRPAAHLLTTSSHREKEIEHIFSSTKLYRIRHLLGLSRGRAWLHEPSALFLGAMVNGQHEPA